MKIELPGGSVAGHFIISTDKRGVIAEFDNLITNSGLGRMGSSAGDYTYWCYVGSGNTPPQFTDTSLANTVARTSSNYVSAQDTVQSVPPYFATQTKYYEFPIGAAAGNLTEVGTGWLDSTYHLYSRALILDAEGLPTTITILPTEILRVTYVLRMYIPTEDVTGTVTLGGNVGGTHNWTLRAAQVATMNSWYAGRAMAPRYSYKGPFPGDLANARVFAFNSSMGPLTGRPSGSAKPCDGPAGAYTSATWSVDTGSHTIKSIWITNYSHGEYQLEFDPPINKTQLQTFSISWSGLTWGRYVAP